MASVDIAPSLNWKCLPMPEAGDHFPIIIDNTIKNIERKFIPRFLEKRADWTCFKRKAMEINTKFAESSNINKEAALVKRILRSTANESIPVIRKPKVRNNPVWFNSDIAKLSR